MWKVPLFDISYTSQERTAVLDVLDSKWLTMGERTLEFERAFADYLGGNVSCTAVSSCTAALHMALLAHNIKAGDEVIISGLTFIANANVVAMSGANLSVADITSERDWNISVTDVKSKLTSSTKAIILVHYAGYPVKISEFVQLAEDHNLILIEDAAHAVGATWQGRQCGTFGDISCFSFFSNKNLSTGEGGMFVTKCPEIDRKAKLLRSHGMSAPTLDRHKSHQFSYDVIQPGLNYRIDEIRSSLGLVQLGKLKENNNKRAHLVQHYINLIDEMGLPVDIPFHPLNTNCISSYHIFPVLLPEGCDRISVMRRLKEKGVQSSIHYPQFSQFSAYRDLSVFSTPVLDGVAPRILTLPLYPDLSEMQVDYVIAALGESLNL
jgi:dTDP-4-amino-4,6-dideoxygalactose transaminase